MRAHPAVLLVDDDVDATRLLEMLLERRGFAVTSAESVSAALAAAQRRRFDVLVSDIGLPDGTGYQLLECLRRDISMPAIALTGAATSEDAQRSQDAGFDVHLAKPVEVEQLVATIRRLIQP